MTHNTIQRDCTGSELVLGSVYGMRQWFMEVGWSFPSAFLEGHNGYRWSLSGQNTARCAVDERWINERVIGARDIRATESPLGFALDIADNVKRLFEKYPGALTISSIYKGGVFHRGEDYFSPALRFSEGVWKYSDPWTGGHFFLSVCVPMEKHDIGDPICTCGFYAYTNETSLQANSITGADNIYFGIVRSWGHVTEGTKGFRAEYSEIVGLTGRMIGQYNKWWTSPNPRAEVLEEERGLIPTTLPRYKNLEEMFARYKELSES